MKLSGVMMERLVANLEFDYVPSECVSDFDEYEVHGLHLRTRMNQSHHRSL